MRTYPFETWDVFTDQRFAGNQLAVVFDADDLTTEQMQTITREFNLAETSFVLAPEDSAHTARVRIFTIGYEMPFAGHPTVGTSLAIAKTRSLAGPLKLELNAGLFPISLSEKNGSSFAEFQNPNLPTENGAAPSAEMLEAALSLPAGSINREAHRPRRVGAGVDFIYANAPLDAVRNARVNMNAFDALNIKEPVGVLLYAEGGDVRDTDYHVRMFAPGAGILEDAATGSAAAGLPGQIALSETLKDGSHNWIVEQGIEMGRPSRIHVRLNVTSGKLDAVWIGGNAVQVQSGTLSL